MKLIFRKQKDIIILSDDKKEWTWKSDNDIIRFIKNTLIRQRYIGDIKGSTKNSSHEIRNYSSVEIKK